jgi:general secretion pathway protein F
MNRFAYQAYTGKGDLVRGEIEARSQTHALQRLRSQGLIAFAAEPVSAARKNSVWTLELRSRRVGSAARLAFVYELGILLRAQLPIDQALRLLPEQAELRKCAAVLRAIAESVAGGKTLGEALAVDRELLHEHEAAMIRAAEHTGSVAEMLLQLAAAMRRQIELKARLKAALTYPVVLLLMSLFTIGVIAAVLVPNLLPLFEGTGTAPPLIIRIFIRLHGNFGSLVMMLAMLAAIAFAAAQRLKSNENVLEKRDRLFLRLPVIGPLVEGTETVRTAQSLGLLLKSGIPLLQALSIVQKACKNRAVRAALGRAAEKVASGVRLARAFAELSVMPQASCHLAAVGEEANRLAELMAHIAQMNESAVQQRVERLMTLLTPILTLMMGVLVAGLIMSIMRAILSVNDLVLN